MTDELKLLIDKYIDAFLDQKEVRQYFILEKQINESEEIRLLQEELKASQKALALSINDNELHKINLTKYNDVKFRFDNHPLVCNYNLIKEKIFDELKSLEEDIKRAL